MINFCDPEKWIPTGDCEEKELFDKVWTAASDNPNSRIKRYEDRGSELSSVEKAYAMAPNALSREEYQTLLDMINRRYDRRILQYENGEKDWEFRIATTVLISGTKRC